MFRRIDGLECFGVCGGGQAERIYGFAHAGPFEKECEVGKGRRRCFAVAAHMDRLLELWRVLGALSRKCDGILHPKRHESMGKRKIFRCLQVLFERAELTDRGNAGIFVGRWGRCERRCLRFTEALGR